MADGSVPDPSSEPLMMPTKLRGVFGERRTPPAAWREFTDPNGRGRAALTGGRTPW